MKNRPIYGRIPVDYAPMQDLSIDIKTMPQAFGGYHLLLIITCDQTNFMIAVPLRDRTAQTIAEALIYRVIYVVRRRGRLAPHQPLSVCALLPAPREEQASTASWEPWPPFEAAEMD